MESCGRACDAGIELVEVPVMTAGRMPALRAAIAAGREAGHPVGARTVIAPEQVDEVASAGAAFTFSPGYDPEIAEAAARRGLAHLPGVATASELTRAVRGGHRWLSRSGRPSNPAQLDTLAGLAIP